MKYIICLKKSRFLSFSCSVNTIVIWIQITAKFLRQKLTIDLYTQKTSWVCMSVFL